MTPAKDFEHNLITEYNRSKETLISKFSGTLSKQEAKAGIDATLLRASTKQASIIINELPSEYLAGVYIESDYLAQKVPTYVGFDLTKVSDANLNKITKDTIGNIGNFNKELANNLNWEYNGLLADNELVNSIEKHGWTANTEKRMLKMGFDKDTINLIKQQTTTNKMIQILEHQGIRGGMHPNEVSKLLQPHIRSIFGDGGVVIDNVGKIRKEIIIDADGQYKWIEKRVTKPYRATIRTYSETISRSSMLRAHRTGRLETLHQSGFVQKWRYISSMSANMCGQCGAMHGAILDDPNEFAGGLHAKCACLGPSPIWKSETGLINHTDEYYENQRDQWFWKQHQLKKYNLTLPKGKKIPNYNFLPKDMLKGMPSKAGMRKIRAELLGQPLKALKAPKISKPILKKVIKPKPVKKISKKPKEKVPEKISPTKTTKEQLKEDKKIGKELYDPTKKTGKEHGLVIDEKGNKHYAVGDKHSIRLERPDASHTKYHTHPGSATGVPEGFSDADVNNFLFAKSAKRTVVITDKNLHILTKTDKTPTSFISGEQIGFKQRFKDMRTAKMMTIDPAKRKYMSSYVSSLQYANRAMAKRYNCIYEIIPR
jgi:hypothetical protein